MAIKDDRIVITERKSYFHAILNYARGVSKKYGKIHSGCKHVAYLMLIEGVCRLSGLIFTTYQTQELPNRYATLFGRLE